MCRGRGLGLCPVSCARCLDRPGPVWITTGIEDGRTVARCRSLRPGHFWPCVAIVIRDFWPGLLWASLLPCGGLSLALWACRTFAVSIVACGASLGLWRACLGWLGTAGGPAVSIWGKGRARAINSGPVSRCLPGFASCLPCLGLFRPLWGFFYRCVWVWLVCGVSPPLRGKRKTARCGSFLLGWCGVSPSIEKLPAGLAWILSRYAGRASPL